LTFYDHPPTTTTYSLSLHDALPISAAPLCGDRGEPIGRHVNLPSSGLLGMVPAARAANHAPISAYGMGARWMTARAAGTMPSSPDRKSTRLNSSHVKNS